MEEKKEVRTLTPLLIVMLTIPESGADLVIWMLIRLEFGTTT